MGTVYFVNGFLEAGKTTFIIDLIHRESFRVAGKTLILLCEEGDREYDERELAETVAQRDVVKCRVLELKKTNAPQDEIITLT